MNEEVIEDEWVLWGSYPAVAGYTRNPFTGEPQPIRSAYVGESEWQRAHEFLDASGAVPTGKNRKRIALGDSFVEVHAPADYHPEQNAWGVGYPYLNAPAPLALFEFFHQLMDAGSFILEQRDSQLKRMVTSAETKARIGELFAYAVVVSSGADMLRLHEANAAELRAKYGGGNPLTGERA